MSEDHDQQDAPFAAEFAVLEALNRAFPMTENNDKYFNWEENYGCGFDSVDLKLMLNIVSQKS